MPVLKPYFAETMLQSLNLKGSLKDLSTKLLTLLSDEGYATVSDVHKALFPMATLASANTQLNRLISELNHAAEDHQLPLKVAITANKKAGAQNRQVWFEGEVTTAAHFRTDELASLSKSSLVSPKGQPLIQHPKLLIVTCNEFESEAVMEAFGPVQTFTPGSPSMGSLGVHHGVHLYHLVSRQGNQRAQMAMREAIQLLRPRSIVACGVAFGAQPEKQRIGDVVVATQIVEYELTRIGTSRPLHRGAIQEASPHFLQRLATLKHHARQDCKLPVMHMGQVLSGEKLIDHLEFRDGLLEQFPEAIGGEMEGVGLFMAASSARIDWCLLKGICDFADGQKNTPSKDADQKLAAENAVYVLKCLLSMSPLYPTEPEEPGLRNAVLPDFKTQDVTEVPTGAMVQPKGQHTSLEKDAKNQLSLGARPDQVDVFEHLQTWVDAPQAPPMFALLGEYGMGKTITAQHFALKLKGRLQEDPNRRIPLLFDLRFVSGLHERLPGLEDTLMECMNRGWMAREDGKPYTFEMVLEWISRGAVIIIDGLDEALVKLNANDGKIFTRSLLSLVTDHRETLQRHRENAPAETPDPKHIPRLLITCRTQYFRTLRDQKNHFSGDERLKLEEAFQALILVPWQPKQVDQYLRAVLKTQDLKRIHETLEAVHNLQELSQRPYTLNLIAQLLPDLERERLAGRSISGVTLYHKMVTRWLERDAGKHTIAAEDKLLLATHMAHQLWVQGEGTLSASSIENWFHAWLDSRPELAAKYRGINREQLEEDLRTSTFLAREDTPEGSTVGFRFAHTSLLEYFLASHLLNSVMNNLSQGWAIPEPSRETLHFLGQMLAELQETDPLAFQHFQSTLRQWRNEYQPKISELIFTYALQAQEEKHPRVSLVGMNLAGAKLRYKHIHGAGNQKLNLAGVNFTGADLRDTEWENVRLDRATFQCSQLDRSDFQECAFAASTWDGANLTGTQFRKCTFKDNTFADIQTHQTYFVHCSGLPEDIPGTLQLPLKQPLKGKPLPARGHALRVYSASWSPDGKTLTTAGNDHCILLRDAKTGHLVREILTDSEEVHHVKWSPDGQWIASVSSYGDLSVVDPQLMLEYIDEEIDPLMVCNHPFSWSPDSERIACLLETGLVGILHIHKGYFESKWELNQKPKGVFWSPDGERIAVMTDREVVLLDAITGEVLSKLHPGYEPTALAWSPDAERLAIVHTAVQISIVDGFDFETLDCFQFHGSERWLLKWSPDGHALAYFGGEQPILILNPVTGEVRHQMPTLPFRTFSLDWSPDSTKIVCTGFGGNVVTMNVAEQEIDLQIAGAKERMQSPVYSPAGDHMAWINTPDQVTVVSVTTGALLNQQVFPGGVHAIQWSMDGRLLAVAQPHGTVWIADALSGECRVDFRFHKKEGALLSWSPVQNILVAAGLRTGALLIIDAERSQLLHDLDPHNAGVRSISWSPDGTEFVTASQDVLAVIFDVKSGHIARFFSKHDDDIVRALWSPDGSKIVTHAQKQILVNNAESGKVVFEVKQWVDRVGDVCWSPDGSKLAISGWGDWWWVINADTGATIAESFEHWIDHFAWSPDGTKLALLTAESSLYILETQHYQPVFSCLHGMNQAHFIAWSQDGASLAISGADGLVKVFEGEKPKESKLFFSIKGAYCSWTAGGELMGVKGEAHKHIFFAVEQRKSLPLILPLEAAGLLIHDG